MISGAAPCFPDASQAIHQHHNQMYPDVLETSSATSEAGGSETTQLGSFLCSLSILKDKVHQVQSLANLFFPDENHQDEMDGSTSVALASMGTLIQEIVVTASSMMFNCQQMALCSPQGLHNNNNNHHQHSIVSTSSYMGAKKQDIKQVSNDGLTQLNPSNNGKSNNNLGFLDGGSFFNWYVDNTSYSHTNNNTTPMIQNSISRDCSRMSITTATTATTTTISTERKGNLTRVTNQDPKEIATTTSSSQGYDIVELDAAALLAKYTHYCQVCGKGFKRDANLRMHMRAHGDEYKSSAALSNPLKNKNNENGGQSSTKAVPRKYSCPQEGCKWNKKHAKFQPLKSMICVKNHYKRSHCPKMYVCKRCNLKQFSVLSDLRTHEKHCGDLKWQCSCGTTFSRKDKLMGHVALFVGHSPLVSPLGHSSNKLFDNLQSLQNPI